MKRREDEGAILILLFRPRNFALLLSHFNICVALFCWKIILALKNGGKRQFFFLKGWYICCIGWLCHYFGAFEFFKAIKYKINQSRTQFSTLKIRHCNFLVMICSKLDKEKSEAYDRTLTRIAWLYNIQNRHNKRNNTCTILTHFANAVTAVITRRLASETIALYIIY